jgi:hypothetical protein
LKRVFVTSAVILVEGILHSRDSKSRAVGRYVPIALADLLAKVRIGRLSSLASLGNLLNAKGVPSGGCGRISTNVD